MSAYSSLEGRPDSRVVLCCEHASNQVPPEYNNLGLAEEHLNDHIGWDVGAAHVVHAIAAALNAPAVLSNFSRLLIDCNRAVEEASLIPECSDGVDVPGNVGIDERERQSRVDRFYMPYHDALDQTLERHRRAILVSVHSFTPALRTGLDTAPRPFDAGVLFDEYPTPAQRFGEGLAATGLRVRYNEPYSGLAGLIFSARLHGLRHGREYLELELNNLSLRTHQAVAAVARRVSVAIEHLLEER